MEIIRRDTEEMLKHFDKYSDTDVIINKLYSDVVECGLTGEIGEAYLTVAGAIVDLKNKYPKAVAVLSSFLILYTQEVYKYTTMLTQQKIATVQSEAIN